MAYRLKFPAISSRSTDRIDPGYEIEAVRDGGVSSLTFSAILHDDILIELVGRGPLEGVSLDAGGRVDQQQVDRLLLLFAVAQFEKALRSGTLALATGEDVGKSVRYKVTCNDLSAIFSAALHKECSYQLAKGRDFYCSATRDNPVTRITPALCRECVVPDTKWMCSHLAHPDSGIEFGADGECVSSPNAMCNRGRPEIQKIALCRPGGHKCWERIVEPEPARRSRPFVPEALPEALDFLHATWCLAFGKKYRLLNLRRAMDTATLVAPCTTRKDFVACMSALDDIVKSMKIDDDLLAESDLGKEDIKGDKTLNRLGACLRNKISDPGQLQAGIDSVDVLRRTNQIRVALQHSGRSNELPRMLASLGLSQSDDWAERWTAIRAHVTEALVDIRKALGALADLE
jgi:hypothetical protein